MGKLTEEQVSYILNKKPNIKYRIFIETGTRYGWTLSNISHMFEICHTIEISEYYYNYTKNGLHDKNRFPYIVDRKNITFHLGDSIDVLKELLPKINESAFFFLDSHFMNSGGSKGIRGKLEVPLYVELDMLNKRNFDDLIVVDDIRTFEKPPCKETSYCDWSNINKKDILKHYSKCKVSEEYCDRFLLL